MGRRTTLKRALVVQNSPIETLGSNFGAVLREAGFSFRGLGIHGDALQDPQPPFPAVSDIEMLVALVRPCVGQRPLSCAACRGAVPWRGPWRRCANSGCVLRGSTAV